jgi:hypothetical protein
MVKPTIYDLLVLILFGFILLVADRFLRIEQFISIEKFTDKPCGVYKLGLEPRPSCDSELRCINGFCGDDAPPRLKPNMLPVFP